MYQFDILFKDLGSVRFFLSRFKISVFYFNIFQNVIYSCDGKAAFCHRILLEIILICWFGAQETFLNITNVQNSCAA